MLLLEIFILFLIMKKSKWIWICRRHEDLRYNEKTHAYETHKWNICNIHEALFHVAQLPKWTLHKQVHWMDPQYHEAHKICPYSR